MVINNILTDNIQRKKSPSQSREQILKQDL